MLLHQTVCDYYPVQPMGFRFGYCKMDTWILFVRVLLGFVGFFGSLCGVFWAAFPLKTSYLVILAYS